MKSREYLVELRDKVREGKPFNTFTFGKMENIEEILNFPNAEIDRLSDDIDKNS